MNQLNFNDLPLRSAPSLMRHKKAVVEIPHSELLRHGFQPDSLRIVFPPRNPNRAEECHVSLYYRYLEFLRKSMMNPLGSLSHSKIMLLPHQVQTALRIINSMIPRFLIADEVGLGKTIETGLIIKEMKLKYHYKKFLVIVPAPLTFQWQKELEYKFNEKFTILDAREWKKNPRILYTENQIITSLDFSKNSPYMEEFARHHYDLIVFDEAHRLRKDEKLTTKAWTLASALSGKTTALLLLSATPFRGKIEEIYYMIHLLNPDILGPLTTLKRDYENVPGFSLSRLIEPVVIRRRKKDIGGFTKRFVKTIKITLNKEERRFYDETTEYVRREYDLAMKKGNTFKSFIMIVLQKLLDSSSHALLSALEKRKRKLEKSYFIIDHLQNGREDILLETDVDEAELDERLSGILDLDEIDIKDLAYELEIINRLISYGASIETDTKLVMLRRSIAEFRKSGHQKIIIFTQFRKTQDAIADFLKKDYPTGIFHGGMNAREKEKAIEAFYADLDILILTDAGGEGRNLQIASVLINYDLPWSPVRMEQRIGRIHRFGQKKDVFILNYASKDTVAEKVIDILQYKIDLFENAFGSTDALLGIMENDETYYKSLWEFLQNKKSEKEIKAEARINLREAEKSVLLLDDLLSLSVVGFNLKAYEKALNLSQSQNENEKEIRGLILDYYTANKIPWEKEKPGVYRISKKPPIGRKPNKQKKMDIPSWRGSFQLSQTEKNDSLEFFSLGHPVVDMALNAISTGGKNKTIYHFYHPEKRGIKLDLEIRIRMDREYRLPFARFMDAERNFSVQEVPADILAGKNLDTQKFIYTDINRQIRPAIASAILSVLPEAAEEIRSTKQRIQSSLDFYTARISESHEEKKRELTEKIEIQRGKMAWYGDNRMRSALQRTKNIQHEEESHYQSKLMEITGYLKESIQIHIIQIGIVEKQPKNN